MLKPDIAHQINKGYLYSLQKSLSEILILILILYSPVVVLIIILLAALSGFGLRYTHKERPNPQPTNTREFTGLIWTAHFMYDNKGWPSFERAAQMLEDTGENQREKEEEVWKCDSA